MNALSILAIVAALIIIVAMFWASFRRWLGRQFQLLGILIAHYFPQVTVWVGEVLEVIAGYIGTYSIILLITTAASVILMSVAILVGSPLLTGMLFVVCLGLIVLAWLPAGLIMRLFRVTTGIVPCWLKTIIATAAFIGFMGIVFPEVITFMTLIGLALIGFIFAAGTRRTNMVDKLIIPLTIVMIAVVSWKYVAPDGFRSTTRYVASWSKVFNATKDRGSINNETEAATTYAIALKDISVLYTISEKKGVSFVDSLVAKRIAKGDTLRLWSHKNEVLIVDGQGLLQIQLRNNKGTFINGDKFWVEAEFVQTVSPREIMANARAKAKAKNLSPRSEEVKVIKPDYFMLEGREIFPLKAGEETPWFGCLGQLKIFSPTFDYVIKVSDGTEYAGGKDTAIPDKEGCYFKVVAKSDQVVTAVKV